MIKLAPIALFTYNRPKHTKLVIDALAANKLSSKSKIYIFQDGLRPDASIDEIEQWKKTNTLLKSINSFHDVIVDVSETNKGCGQAIVAGINKVLEENDRIIVVEDDILVSSTFITYMNEGLSYFEHEEQIGSINAYSLKFPFSTPYYYFILGVNPYGWATWKNRWELYNNDASQLLSQLKNKKAFKNWDFGGTRQMLESCVNNNFEGAWDVKWYSSLFLNNKLGLFPKTSFSSNIGFDQQATHTSSISLEYQSFQFCKDELNQSEVFTDFEQLKIQENQQLKRRIIQFYFKLNKIPFGNERFKFCYLKFKHLVKTKIFQIR
jgi:hypothetical protein